MATDPWWRRALGVLQVAVGVPVGLFFLLTTAVTVPTMPGGWLDAAVFAAGGTALGLVILGWGLVRMWPGTGTLVRMAGYVLFVPVMALFVLQWSAWSDMTTAIVFLLLLALGVALHGPVLIAAVGWFGLVFFGAGTLWIARGILARPLVIADARGVTVRAQLLPLGTIPWAHVARFVPAGSAVGIALSDPETFRARGLRRFLVRRDVLPVPLGVSLSPRRRGS